MNNEVRRQVMARAAEHCESCLRWAGEQLHLDHAWGRAKDVETVATCWALCARCDLAKTRNEPSRKHWLLEFRRHAEKFELWEEVVKVDRALDWLEAKGAHA